MDWTVAAVIGAYGRIAAASGHLLAALCTLAAVWPAPLAAQPVPRVAAAASVSGALTEIGDAFARDRGRRVTLVFGASDALTRQILEGAPFEMYLAADEESAQRLTAAKRTRGPGLVYATGRLALFVPTGSPLAPDPRLAGLGRLLQRGGAPRFAIANPAVAPYGRAAEAVLRKYGLWERLRPSLVLGESIAQAAQFARTGNAVGGLVAYSLVLAPGMANRGAHVLIAESDHPPLRQRMVLLDRAGETAAQFYAYLQTPAARGILKTHGFAVPE